MQKFGPKKTDEEGQKSADINGKRYVPGKELGEKKKKKRANDCFWNLPKKRNNELNKTRREGNWVGRI